MIEYNKGLGSCIDEKLIDYAMYNAKSLYNIEILYHHYLTEAMKIIPREHHSKAQYQAFKNTIKELEK